MTREEMIVRHLPLAQRLARRYGAPGQPVDDLVQVASIGLIKAVDRWEPERGVTFATYAVPTILGELRRYFRDFTWGVRPPRPVQDLCLAIARAREPLSSALGREPTVADFAARLDRAPEEIVEALRADHGRRLASIEVAVDSDQVGAHDDELARVDAHLTFEWLCSLLDERARAILRMRFHDELSQSEIASRLGLTQMGVSRTLRRSFEAISSRVVQPVPAA
jgi:RNA polymerase sigma-B factor